MCVCFGGWTFSESVYFQIVDARIHDMQEKISNDERRFGSVPREHKDGSNFLV